MPSRAFLARSARRVVKRGKVKAVSLQTDGRLKYRSTKVSVIKTDFMDDHLLKYVLLEESGRGTATRPFTTYQH